MPQVLQPVEAVAVELGARSGGQQRPGIRGGWSNDLETRGRDYALHTNSFCFYSHLQKKGFGSAVTGDKSVT